MVTVLFLITITVFIVTCASLTDTCENKNNLYQCTSSSITYNEAWSTENVFQTPYRGHPHWKRSYQDMNLIVGYVQQKYLSDTNSCTLTINYRLNTKHLPLHSQIIFKYGKNESPLNTYTVTLTESLEYLKTGYPVSISITNYLRQEEASLQFEPIHFKWGVRAVNSSLNGSYGAIVELFGWPYADIQKECEFLGNNAYLGVQILPPVETVLDFNSTVNGHLNPWHYAYQPVSYKLNSRMGNRTQLVEMINVCHSKGIRVYSETVLNHMTAFGVDSYPQHQQTNCVNYGVYGSTGGSPWYTGGNMNEDNEITNTFTGIEFPAVPYDSKDFHCKNANANETLTWYKNRLDLRTESEYVRQRIADHLTDLISVGISGFSFDLARNVHRNDVIGILTKLKDNLGGVLPDDFLVYLKLLLGGEADMLLCKDDSSVSYGNSFYKALVGWSENDKQKIKIWRSDFPKEFSKCEIKVGNKYQSVLGLELYLEQFENTARDPGKDTIYVVNHNVTFHKKNLNYSFAIGIENEEDIAQYQGNDYVLILSSYSFDNYAKNIFDTGIPDGMSDCSLCKVEGCTNNMPKAQAFNEESTGYDATQDGSWVNNVYTRVHRNKDIIYGMNNWLKLKQAQKQ